MAAHMHNTRRSADIVWYHRHLICYPAANKKKKRVSRLLRDALLLDIRCIPAGRARLLICSFHIEILCYAALRAHIIFPSAFDDSIYAYVFLYWFTEFQPAIIAHIAHLGAQHHARHADAAGFRLIASPPLWLCLLPQDYHALLWDVFRWAPANVTTHANDYDIKKSSSASPSLHIATRFT